MLLRPPRSTRTVTLLPYTTLFRSCKVPVLVCQSAAHRPFHRQSFARRDSDHTFGWTFHINFDQLNPMDAVKHLNFSKSVRAFDFCCRQITETRSEEHTSELQSLMSISYAVFCLKKNYHIQI